MGRIWNPHAKRETVGGFLRDWCVVQQGRKIPPESLYDAYLYYCRNLRQHDLTVGEFNDEMEQQGFKMGTRWGQPVWTGVGLSMIEDARVARHYGIRFTPT